MSSNTAIDTERELDRAIEELRGIAAVDLEKPRTMASGTKDRRPVTMQIPVQVNIVLGSADMSIHDVSALETGSTIHLDKRVHDPIDVVVNGIRIARGELTLLEADPSRFGFRITEIM